MEAAWVENLAHDSALLTGHFGRVKPRFHDGCPVNTALMRTPGTVLVNHCPLYWGCRLAGYGNKSPSQ
jgi:hypothetical protein